MCFIRIIGNLFNKINIEDILELEEYNFFVKIEEWKVNWVRPKGVVRVEKIIKLEYYLFKLNNRIWNFRKNNKNMVYRDLRDERSKWDI